MDALRAAEMQDRFGQQAQKIGSVRFRRDDLLKLDFTVSRRLSGARRDADLRSDFTVALYRNPVSPLHGSQPFGYPRFAGGDGLAIASAVGALPFNSQTSGRV